MNENKTNINWYPGHMAKTKRQIKEDLKLIDVIVEILDARIPISSQNPDVKTYSNPHSVCKYSTKSIVDLMVILKPSTVCLVRNKSSVISLFLKFCSQSLSHTNASFSTLN